MVLMTRKQLEEYLGVSTRTIFRLIEADRIPRVRIASQWRFSQEAIDDWVISGHAADKNWRYTS